jgi:hypothetical protein
MHRSRQTLPQALLIFHPAIDVTPQPGLVLTDALDINNNGQILCEATLNGTTRYYILDPISTGINSEKDNFPKEFTLYQNYPNPFNPVTTLRYSIPQNSNVKLVVYDILGKEVVTLVNEEKHGGTYELNWNAVNLPSGVYFYQLQAGSFVENKKMVLLK